MTGRWRPWCWTSTKRPRATRTPAVAGAAAAGLGGHPQELADTGCGRYLMEDARAGRTSGPGG